MLAIVQCFLWAAVATLQIAFYPVPVRRLQFDKVISQPRIFFNVFQDKRTYNEFSAVCSLSLILIELALQFLRSRLQLPLLFLQCCNSFLDAFVHDLSRFLKSA